jgi:predicted SprT family Zn-dependent metalloprotease
MVQRIVRKRYPKLKARIRFAQDIPRNGRHPRCGVTIFPDSGGIPLILINPEIPVSGALEVMAHELAHVIVGPDKPPHGKEWKKAFAWIHREYCKRVES